MKKLILSFAVVLAASTFVLGQTADLVPIQLGIKAGANLSTINGQSFNSEYRLNYLLGGYLTFNLSNSIGIQPELEFSQVSAVTSSNFNNIYGDFGPSITNNPHLQYMSIPVLLNLGGKILKFQVGPQYSVLMNGNESFWANGRQAFTGNDVDLDAGIWINLPLHLNVSARYIFGLSNINDINSNYNGDTWNSRQVQLAVGFRL
jgi:hypothetical protein